MKSQYHYKNSNAFKLRTEQKDHKEEKKSIPSSGIDSLKLAFRFGVTLGLIGAFLRGSYLAYEKVSEGRIGSSVSFRPSKDIVYPDVAVCVGTIVDVRALNIAGLVQLHEHVRGQFRNVIRDLRYKRVSKTANWRNASDLEALGYEENEVWSEYLGFNRGYVNYCLNFHPPVNSTLGAENDLFVDIDMTNGIGFTVIRLTHEGNHFPSNNRVFGKVSIVPALKGQANQAIYELGMEEKRYLSRDERECRRNDEEKASQGSRDLVSGLSVYQCYENFVENQLGCRLPWNVHSWRPNCTTTEQMLHFLELSQNILAMGNADFIELTGCTPRCNINIYEALKVSDVIPTEPAHLQPARNYSWLQVELFFSASEIRTETEVVLYDVLSAIGEIGGYLGMLLGYSMLSFYSILEAIMQRVVTKKSFK